MVGVILAPFRVVWQADLLQVLTARLQQRTAWTHWRRTPGLLSQRRPLLPASATVRPATERLCLALVFQHFGSMVAPSMRAAALAAMLMGAAEALPTALLSEALAAATSTTTAPLTPPTVSPC